MSNLLIVDDHAVVRQAIRLAFRYVRGLVLREAVDGNDAIEVVEFDREKLFGKIQKFETAVFTRLQELASDSAHHAERQAVSDAATTISILKKDKLSDPV